ncbi:MAG: GH116 family glycosyl-hydrolase [Ferruginibacter sp.]
MKRRKFFKSSALLTGGFLTAQIPLIAGPFELSEFPHFVFPSDKKLDPKWVESLYKREKPTIYLKTKNELRYIGMPVGGICCGTLYLGGDGRLWLWDIFNQNTLGILPKVLPIKLEGFNVKEINNTHGTLYLKPATEDISPIQQGFALKIKYNGDEIIKRLHQDDWNEIIFEGTYPVATITYIDKKMPLQIKLKAFSPFIPGDAYNSGLPATVQSISIKNASKEDISVDVVGWLENKMLLYSAKQKSGWTRENKILNSEFCNGITLECTNDNKELSNAPDYGNMAFSTLVKNAVCAPDLSNSGNQLKPINEFIKLSENSPVAAITTSHHLKPGQSETADFIISWYTPNVSFPDSPPNQGMTVEDANFHYYTKNFPDAAAVAGYIAGKFTSLRDQTFLWHRNWYESTLPWWFLERTFLNISTLATSTTHRFESGRFYAWEGAGCCHGTCTHVYQYAQAMSRIFPELERDERERVDLGIGFDDATGMIRIRGEKTGPSIDGQAGTVLRIYREYLMSKDGLILKNNWDKIKKAVEFIMLQDKNKDGMLDTPMENTLDALWSGEISWLVGLCIAGVRAGQVMAEEMDDSAFSSRCLEFIEKGRKNMEGSLFNGEYFIHRPDPAEGKKGVGSYNTCHIDQVYGQAWAWQVGLGRVLDKEKTMSALKALWKYNYMPDVGPYIKAHPGGRFYALAGEGGMVMNTNPKMDDKPYGEAKAWQIGYFSECMSGFEHQVAAHMMAEGMIEESLILTRSIHDRYHAYKRNPFNEIECSDHYARAMASYGTFISVCGFTYHGPRGEIGFAPRINPENFKAPFTAAEGWGSYSQQRNEKEFSSKIIVQYGQLKLNEITVDLDIKQAAKNVQVFHNYKAGSCSFEQIGTKCVIRLKDTALIEKGNFLSVKVS